jgi:methylaspartate ammonia-lyase
MIGDCKAMQTFGARGCDHVFRTGDTIPGKERVRVQVDVKCHCLKGRNKELKELNG